MIGGFFAPINIWLSTREEERYQCWIWMTWGCWKEQDVECQEVKHLEVYDGVDWVVNVKAREKQNHKYDLAVMWGPGEGSFHLKNQRDVCGHVDTLTLFKNLLHHLSLKDKFILFYFDLRSLSPFFNVFFFFNFWFWPPAGIQLIV